jgi:hypothetical protein
LKIETARIAEAAAISVRENRVVRLEEVQG